MTRDAVAKVFESTFQELMELRKAGQVEYAHDTSNAFANFERVAQNLGVDRKIILMVYAGKHWDGVHSFIKGHVSQREDVTGRIHDLIVYLLLLKSMIIEDRLPAMIGSRHEGPVPESLKRSFLDSEQGRS
jgi:hypothetical protein